jgi:hypothetical protein
MIAKKFRTSYLPTLFVLFLGLSTSQAAIRDVVAFGATGNGTIDDTTAINNAIAALVPGDSLVFPCGTYMTTSQLLVSVSNVTIDGSGCATIHGAGSGTAAILVIGANETTAPSYGPTVALKATAQELATSFTTVSRLGVRPGDYVYIHQGGLDYSTDTPPGHPTNCDASGCRGEIVKVDSVDENRIKVTTALHDTYDPLINGAVAQKMLNPVTGMTVRNITLEGNPSLLLGFEMNGVAESQVQGVTVRNVQGAAVFTSGSFNLSYSNITVSQAGSTSCGDAVNLYIAGNLKVYGMSVSNENPGKGTGCLANGAFGFGVYEVANGRFSRVMVDATGAYGRPFKLTAARWNTFNSLTVKNGVTANNGITLNYYSSHNTFNNCVVTNNGAGTGTGTGNAGINSFGNFNQYNTFNHCTVAGNGNTQFYVSGNDALSLGQDSHVTIRGGTFRGTNVVEPVILIAGSNASVVGANINGQGSAGLWIVSPNACVNNNILTGTFGSGGIVVYDPTTNIGTGNILNGNSSNLGVGQCSPPASSAGD